MSSVLCKVNGDASCELSTYAFGKFLGTTIIIDDHILNNTGRGVPKSIAIKIPALQCVYKCIRIDRTVYLLTGVKIEKAAGCINYYYVVMNTNANKQGHRIIVECEQLGSIV